MHQGFANHWHRERGYRADAHADAQADAHAEEPADHVAEPNEVEPGEAELEEGDAEEAEVKAELKEEHEARPPADRSGWALKGVDPLLFVGRATDNTGLLYHLISPPCLTTCCCKQAGWLMFAEEEHDERRFHSVRVGHELPRTMVISQPRHDPGPSVKRRGRTLISNRTRPSNRSGSVQSVDWMKEAQVEF